MNQDHQLIFETWDERQGAGGHAEKGGHRRPGRRKTCIINFPARKIALILPLIKLHYLFVPLSQLHFLGLAEPV